MSQPKNIVLLGATGSIGENTLRVLRQHPDKLRLVGIAGRSQVKALAEIARDFAVEHVVIFDETRCEQARSDGVFPKGTQLACGIDGLIGLATLADADLVVAAIVGTQSLQPALAALEAGKDVALASKEILVMAGKFVTEAAQKAGARLLPMDSEHNAIFQCLPNGQCENVEKLILTASGGPFRDYSLEQMAKVTKADALKHPNWSMGPKITVDSATMANKGLEVIEAHWLFGKRRHEIDVVVHPQSIVHSMVQFVDGSILAQMSPPSMTFAIQHCLLYPARAEGVDATCDFSEMMTLEFRPPDFQRFPALRLALEAMEAEGIAPAVFNAANEVAVAAFLEERIAYQDIARVIESTLEKAGSREPDNLNALLESDAQARHLASDFVAGTLTER